MCYDDAARPPTFTVGFCMGGALSFLTAAANAPLAGAIGFYAPLADLNGTYLDRAGQVTHPVLGLFGDSDQVIAVSVPQAFDEKLKEGGIEHEVVIYPGAPHGFFELQMPQYADDAWKRVLDFLHAHTGAHSG